MPTELEPKRGRFHSTEEDFIRKNIEAFSIEEIAKKLNRKPETVRDRAVKMGLNPKDGTAELDILQTKIIDDFKKTPEWQALNDEFTEDEIAYFTHRYSKIMAQFGKDNTTATEEAQVFQFIKFELLMSRNLKLSKRAITEMKEYEERVSQIYRRNADQEMSQADVDAVTELKNLLAAARDSQQSRSTEYEKLHQRHSAVLKDLKGTRDQRIEKFQSASKDIVNLLKSLHEESFRKSEGRQMELVKIASEKEYDRLSEYHSYSNGELDRPILNSDTVGTEDN